MKNSVVYLAMCLALATTMWAQSSSSSGTTQSGSSDTQMQQSQASDSSQGNSIEGCIVKRETAFYIQPKSGPATRLNAGSQDLSSHVGQDVRVTGSTEDKSSASSSQGSAGSSTSTSAEGDFLVSRVDVVAATCPPGTPGQQGSSQQNPPQ